MYWELSCSLSLGHCCLIKSAPVPCLNLSAGAAVNQRDGVRRQGSSGAASLFSPDPVPATESFAVPELVAKCLRRVWSKDHLLKSRLNLETFGFYYMSKVVFVLPLLLVMNQRIFQNWYHCFSPEVRGWIAGLQSYGFSTTLRHDTSPRLTRSLFSNSTVLLQSRIHLGSEHLSFDLM